MRFRTLMVVLVCLAVAALAFSLSGTSQKLEDQPKFETIQIGKGGPPRWSPDGTRLAFVSEGWLCVANADGSGETRRIAKLQPWTFDWMSDSTFVVSERVPWSPPGRARGHKFMIETLDMEGRVEVVAHDSMAAKPESYDHSYLSAPFVLRDGTVGYYEVHERSGEETKVFKTIKPGRLAAEETGKQINVSVEPYPWGDIWLERLDGTGNRRVTAGDRKYTLPQLSPDGLKIMAYFGGYYGGGLDILDTAGTVLASIRARKVNSGVYATPTQETWSPDGTRIAYCLWAERADTTYSSDIWLMDLNAKGEIQVTNTPDRIETSPVFSPDGRKIAYSTENAQIFVTKLR